jgi:hypothetical protein
MMTDHDTGTREERLAFIRCNGRDHEVAVSQASSSLRFHAHRREK